MARPRKLGIESAHWDVHILEDDTKIDMLIDAQGYGAFTIYFFLCQKAYANGYFYRWSYPDAATTARKIGGGCGSETVKQVVSLCLRIGLFDKSLFEREKVLTSKGIQRRYMMAIQKRSCKEVDDKLWLLDSEESEGFVVMPKNRGFLPENAGFLPKNDIESKGKESKVNSLSRSDASASENAASADSIPSWEVVQAFAEANQIAENVAQKFYAYYQKTGWQTKSGIPVQNWQNTLCYWAQKEKARPPKVESHVPKSDNAEAYRSFIYNIDE